MDQTAYSYEYRYCKIDLEAHRISTVGGTCNHIILSRNSTETAPGYLRRVTWGYRNVPHSNGDSSGGGRRDPVVITKLAMRSGEVSFHRVSYLHLRHFQRRLLV